MNNLQWIIQEHDLIFVFFPDGWVVGWGGGGGGVIVLGGQDPINTFNFYHWKEETMKQIVP